ncbi:isocitrate lyase/phosphoenolpyruvate mutase family protein [Streptomyces acidiscabies]|uniref:Phosphoenolpyruvate phosphomutase n=1 Tax=Streptomyces acidiscabies TaxID=42234 RepID=A0A0L0KI57_9ACTN|nr:isocitrate lyase/phosphoenolpyruvate mutase family protein [Streptomyces acidiscabies]KND37244.1 phosphoenolpyruvate phosphomutase [Streptomyces acidiscabies]
MQRITHRSFRSVLEGRADDVVRIAGAHDALGALLAEEAGFQAVWSSSLEVSAARGLPDASLLGMDEYLRAAAQMQSVLGIPVVVDCDTGYGGRMNVAHMVHEFEAAGLTAVCMEDKVFPKINSFAGGDQALVDADEFAHRIEIAKNAQSTAEMVVIARTEAMICGLGVDAALKRCMAYADSGADAVLVHSKSSNRKEVSEFLDKWDAHCPVVIVPTTYPDWHVADIREAGVAAVIYANHGLRATVSALRATFRSVYDHGHTLAVEERIASVQDVFALQRLDTWRALED